MTFWTIGILTNLFEILRDLIGNFSSLKKYSKSAEYKEIHRRINTNCLNLIKNFCDLIPAGTGSEFFQKIFASHPNHGVVGFAGFLAGAISTYQTF
ncbi:unnamed protein product (macronuclear) [Paramecium tetraurelia]|uniref:Uncharacterized protein n=1 Tax=Paramecium tetraurelia TaxID=5888 RepID=A0BR22_PARTE|nr:uncharacterized protein GSPATT00031218001 [Paramecium tetraurelia]CAK60989.1 unnamed protein product [Paramecium tetraurelia]|eukprot:XP_001428387.1 hypothetical protein (macronuclear) [Paramecium tetraurelia strain d4-2]